MIMGHSNSDMDCMGASMGIYRLAENFGKKAQIVLNQNGNNLGSFLKELADNSQYKDIVVDPQEAMSQMDEDTLLVVVDTNKKNYVESVEVLQKAKKIVVIDHHRRSPDYIENATLTFHEVYASSASELVTELVEYAQAEVELCDIEAEALYAGIMMDTKNFTFKTGVRTFEAAAYLRKFGVDIIRVKKWFQADLESYNLIADIVRNTEIINDSIAIGIYTNSEDSNANLICAKAADELLTISDITASFVIGKIGEKVFISGRSIGDVNVQVILEKLGGGGHITIKKVNNTKSDYFMHIIKNIGEEMTSNDVDILINDFLTYDLITKEEAKLLKVATSDNVLLLAKDVKDKLRAKIFKNMLLNIE